VPGIILCPPASFQEISAILFYFLNNLLILAETVVLLISRWREITKFRRPTACPRDPERGLY